MSYTFLNLSPAFPADNSDPAATYTAAEDQDLILVAPSSGSVRFAINDTRPAEYPQKFVPLSPGERFPFQIKAGETLWPAGVNAASGAQLLVMY